MSDQTSQFEEWADKVVADMCRSIWGIAPEDWPGGELIPPDREFLHPDGVMDWFTSLPTIMEMREKAEAADDLAIEHEPEMN